MKSEKIEEKYLKKMQELWGKEENMMGDIHEGLDKLLLEALTELGCKELGEFYRSVQKNLQFYYA